MFSNIEETYDKLPKHLNSAIAKMFYCLCKGAKNGRNVKIAKTYIFFWFLNLHNLLQIPSNHFKLHIFWNYTWRCVWKLHIHCKILWIFFDTLKTGHNEKSFIFLERNRCATIWKYSKLNSILRVMPSLHKNIWVVGKWSRPWTK